MIPSHALRKMRACKALMASANEGEAAAARAAHERLLTKYGAPPADDEASEQAARSELREHVEMSWEEAERFAEAHWDRSRRPREQTLSDEEIAKFSDWLNAEHAAELASIFGGTGESWGA